MSKTVIEIDVVFGEPPDSVQAAKIILVKKGDLYVMRLAPDIMTGKASYHESGVSHSFTNLVNRRSGEGEPAGQKLRDMKGHLMVSGWGCPSPLEPTGYEPKADTKVRRTLIVPKPGIGWYCHVWAIERGRKDLAEEIVSTNPWLKVPVVASLLADWSDPWILVTVCFWLSNEPYKVFKYSPALPGRVPYVTIPDAFEGTWLGKPGPKWYPGEAYPEEWLREADQFVARRKAWEERHQQAAGGP